MTEHEKLMAIKKSLIDAGIQPGDEMEFHSLCGGQSRKLKGLWNAVVMAVEEDRIYWKQIRTSNAFELATECGLMPL